MWQCLYTFGNVLSQLIQWACEICVFYLSLSERAGVYPHLSPLGRDQELCMEPCQSWLPQSLTFTSHAGSTGGGRWQQVVIDSCDRVLLMTELLPPFEAWLQGDQAGGMWKEPKRMVAHGQPPPPLPVALSYYSKSWAENSSLKGIIFVSVKLQSRTRLQSCFSGQELFGDRRGSRGWRGHHLGPEGPWPLASPRKLYKGSCSAHGGSS